MLAVIRLGRRGMAVVVKIGAALHVRDVNGGVNARRWRGGRSSFLTKDAALELPILLAGVAMILLGERHCRGPSLDCCEICWWILSRGNGGWCCC